MNFKLLLLIPILLVTSSVESKRHSQKRKSERLQKIPTGTDKVLADALSKQTKNMTFEEAAAAKDHFLKEKQLDMAIKSGQRLLAVAGDQEIMRKTRLELAEIFLEQNNYKEADKYAQDYQKFYPSAADVKRSQYIAIRANYLDRLSSDRDQEKAHTTIKLAETFLDKYKNEPLYGQSVLEMMNECYQSLLRSELNIIATTLNTFNNTKQKTVLAAAEKRLEYAKKYLKHVPQGQKKISEYELQLAQASGQKELIKAKELELSELRKKTIATAQKEKGILDTAKSYFIEDNAAYFA